MAHVDDTPTIEIHYTDDGVARARWTGILACGHIWTCPVCARNLCAKRAERVSRAIATGGGRWQMLTVTLQHHRGMSLHELIGGLMRAWRRTRQGGAIQRLWREKVSASVRAIEVTYGENGWHPHLHVLLRTSEWSAAEHALLMSRWATIVERELGKDCLPSRAHGLAWSAPFEGDDASKLASYVSKLGLEVAGVTKERSTSPWDILRRASRGDRKYVRLWNEFYAATKGRRRIEFDERAARLAPEEVPDEDTREPYVIDVSRDDLRAVGREERARPGIFALLLTAAELGGEPAVQEWLAWCRSRNGRTLSHGHPRAPEASAQSS